MKEGTKDIVEVASIIIGVLVLGLGVGVTIASNGEPVGPAVMIVGAFCAIAMSLLRFHRVTSRAGL